MSLISVLRNHWNNDSRSLERFQGTHPMAPPYTDGELSLVVRGVRFYNPEIIIVFRYRNEHSFEKNHGYVQGRCIITQIVVIQIWFTCDSHLVQT